VPRCRREVARADLEAVTGLVAKLAVVGTVRRERPGMVEVAAPEPEPLVVPLVKLTAAPVPDLDFEAAFRTSARPRARPREHLVVNHAPEPPPVLLGRFRWSADLH
jgi:hypothetical protein